MNIKYSNPFLRFLKLTKNIKSNAPLSVSIVLSIEFALQRNNSSEESQKLKVRQSGLIEFRDLV
jgi:hypothetical protein